MKKIFAGLLALVCSAALAQNYPSPTYNNVTSQGTASLNNATVSGAFTATGTFTATGKVGLPNLAAQAANTIIGNATSSSATPTAITVAGCNGAAQALQWTNGSGFQCNSSIATSGANANITSLSGLTTALSVAQGGTGRQTLTTHGILVGEGTAAINQLAVGTTGQVLVGSTGADPAFGTSVAGLTFTSAITPQTTGGIIGTTLADNANAGSVGEYNVHSTQNTALTSGTTTNCDSVSLAAGDWDVTGIVTTNPAGTTTTSSVTAGVNTTSATFGTLATGVSNAGQLIGVSVAGGIAVSVAAPVTRVNVSTGTTVYLVCNATFATSTMQASGAIRYRRVR
ncbi:hypothetical protein [Burkholderia sp. BE12]|uniref:hypothetical protein n=1 Tax=Burkholderia sp. BE12 TaxID=2082394 RepID=UPI000CF4FE87|nr:hypothetical protein [Burkholderia sp. BE12]